MKNGRTISIFGSGRIKAGSEQWKEAFQAGFLLTEAGFRICNGGYGGAMKASAKGAKRAGGSTIGITTAEFVGSVRNEFIDEEIRLPTWRERLHQLVKMGDGFLILDGGTGTLVELAVVWEMLAKGLHAKPVVVLGRRMKSLVKHLERNPEVIQPKNLFLAKNPEDAVRYLEGIIGGVRTCRL